MSLVEHARHELELLGEDPAYSAILVAAIAAFASFGHSGGSASVAIEQMYRLLKHENLTSITDNPDEWLDRTEMSGYALWQNIRNSKLMSEDKGKTYWDVDKGTAVFMQSLPYLNRCKVPEQHSSHEWDGVDGKTNEKVCKCDGIADWKGFSQRDR
jgi:hypothetical protein